MVVGDITSGTEVLIIGGGPGGYAAAIRAGQLGLSATLVEKDAYGGTCLNKGCIPSKALVHTTDVVHEVTNADKRGVNASIDIDMGELVEWKDGVVKRLTGGVEKLCEANGVQLMSGRAEFIDQQTARVTSDKEGHTTESIEFEHAIIATGSRPIQLPGFEFDGERILSSKHILELEFVPDSLLVVGGGYIGMELSTVLAKLGCEVTVVEMLDDILPAYPDDVTQVVRKRAEDLGISFTFGEIAQSWDNNDSSVIVTTETEDGEVSEYTAEKVLVAVGREPVTDTFNPKAAGIEPRDDGIIETNNKARTDTENVFAVGDVAGEPMLAHKAYKEGHVAAEVIAGKHAALDYQTIPAAVFTDPEIGTVGLSETEAKEEGFDPIVGKMPLQASGRALTLDDTDGFIRIIADATTEFVLGAEIVSPEASELIGEVGLAIEMGAKLEDITATIHTHPTLSEAVSEAAANARGRSTHTLNQ